MPCAAAKLEGIGRRLKLDRHVGQEERTTHAPSPRPPSAVQAASPLPAHLQAALHHLLQATEQAHELQRERWDFAVEIDSLRAAGLTSTDLRWLLCRGYVEHALEQTQPADSRRTFCFASNLALGTCSCFVLTPAGVELAHTALADGPPPREKVPSPNHHPRGEETPIWDREGHTLYWRGEVVKQFRGEAPYQEAVLRTFQRHNWPRCVSIRLSREGDVIPKLRLRDTIKNLNRSVQPHLRFRQEGNGGRVAWEVREGGTQELPQRDR